MDEWNSEHCKVQHAETKGFLPILLYSGDGDSGDEPENGENSSGGNSLFLLQLFFCHIKELATDLLCYSLVINKIDQFTVMLKLKICYEVFICYQ